MDLDTVSACLDLGEVGPDRYRAGGIHFPGITWTFGGLLVAQVMLAANRTAPDRFVRSCHVTFLSRADPHRPIDLEVERLDDRSTFAHRMVRAHQGDDTRVVATVLLHRHETGPVHQIPMPAVAPPAACPPRSAAGFLVETRDASTPPVFSKPVASDPVLDLWHRVPGLGDDQHLHDAMIGFVSDLHLLEAAWRPVDGASITQLGRVISTTLTQTTWFHQPARIDDWLLYHAESPRAADGRSLCLAHWFTIDGALVASCAQEGLMRLRDRPARSAD